MRKLQMYPGSSVCQSPAIGLIGRRYDERRRLLGLEAERVYYSRLLLFSEREMMRGGVRLLRGLVYSHAAYRVYQLLI